jgi:hypothetical protein
MFSLKISHFTHRNPLPFKELLQGQLGAGSIGHYPMISDPRTLTLNSILLTLEYAEDRKREGTNGQKKIFPGATGITSKIFPRATILTIIGKNYLIQFEVLSKDKKANRV